MAQVGRDRAEHLALALRQDEVVPAERAARAASASSPRRVARGPPRAEVEVARPSGARSPRARSGQAGDLGGVGDLADREPELRRPRRRPPSAPASAAHAARRSAKLGSGTSTTSAVCVAEHDGRVTRARRRASDALVARGERAHDAAPRSAGSSALEAVEARVRRPRAPRSSAASRMSVGVDRVGHVDEHDGRPERDGEQRRRVRAGDHERAAAPPAEQRSQLGRPACLARVVRAAAATTRRRPSRRRLVESARRAGTRPAGRRPSTARSASGVGPPPSSSRIAPRRRSGRVRSKQRQHVGRVRRPSSASRPRDQPRARQLAGHVVVEVGEEPAVARAQLRRGAERRAPPPRARRARAAPAAREARVERRRRLRAGERERQLVGDVEAAERVGRVRVACRDRLDRRADARVERARSGRRLDVSAGEVTR